MGIIVGALDANVKTVFVLITEGSELHGPKFHDDSDEK
jgi:hypothetical protein